LATPPAAQLTRHDISGYAILAVITIYPRKQVRGRSRATSDRATRSTLFLTLVENLTVNGIFAAMEEQEGIETCSDRTAVFSAGRPDSSTSDHPGSTRYRIVSVNLTRSLLFARETSALLL
jgi:hypothetical protein